jgi:TruD family tRNA pseudouridine synthase
MDRKKIKEEELKILLQEHKKNPNLFERKPIVDDEQFLENIGIAFPEDIQKNLLAGYVKIWPQDFIVEEIPKNGDIQTVSSGDFFSTEKNFSAQDQTFYSTLVKCEMSTFEVVEELANLLGIDKKKIQFAGIKDKDAITSQQISIRETDIEKLKNLSYPYFFLKDSYSSNGAIEVGSLQGNKFTLLVRTGKNFDAEKFEKNLKIIEENGFYNFFYSQRFGSPRFINWFWGLLILKGEYKNAVSSFLTSEGQREVLFFKNLREKIKENLGNWEKIEEILSPFPLILTNELKVVRYLKEQPSDFTGALNQIPEQVQMWIFAYASLLFNRKISDLISTNKPLPEKLPLILSKNQNDWIEYYDYLKEDGISTMPLNNLKPFANIQWKKREIKTKESVKIYKTKVIKEGVVLSFSLPKACYATTFLSHLFLLGSGTPPEDISDQIIDTKEMLGENPIKDVLEKFKDISHSKKQDFFEKSE